VHRAIDKITGDKVAIKTMKSNQEHESVPHFILREHECLTEMRDVPGIVPLVATYCEPKHLARQGYSIKFVFPYYEHGDLYQF
jgi:serine/threonine protein kinase